jgi:hypothetical protein
MEVFFPRFQIVPQPATPYIIQLKTCIIEDCFETFKQRRADFVRYLSKHWGEERGRDRSQSVRTFDTQSDRCGDHCRLLCVRPSTQKASLH